MIPVRIIGLLLTGFFLLLFACESSYLDPENPNDQNFFPVSGDLFRIYEVQSINFEVSKQPDTIYYQIRESVVDSFQTTSITQYLLQRERRTNSIDSWQVDSIWTVRHQDGQAILVENNKPLVKLVYPVREGLTWNGNAFNGDEFEEFYFKKVGANESLGDLIFDNTVTVIQNDNQDTLLYRDYRSEIYARNVGLISKDAVILKYCEEVECIGRGVIDYGRIYRMRLLEYGKK